MDKCVKLECLFYLGIISDDEDDDGKAAGDVLPELSSDDEGPEDMDGPGKKKESKGDDDEGG